MTFRRLRRKWRCMLKHGPRGCPHIERHTRRSRRPRRLAEPGRHQAHAEHVSPADLVR